MKKRILILSIIGWLFIINFSNIQADTSEKFTLQSPLNTVATDAQSVFATDLDNDGQVDILSASYADNTIAWYKNNGDGTFSAPSIISNTVVGARSVYAGDLDNDGDIDVITASSTNDTILWFMNNGNSTFTVQAAISITADNVYSLYAEDLDNDGDIDILAASFDDDSISWYQNNGDTTFTAQPKISATADGASSIYAKDLDNDGDIDVLATSANDNTVSWYINNGDTTFAPGVSLSTNSIGASSVYAADLDNDGDNDVIASSSTDNSVSFFTNNGNGTFTAPVPISTTASGVSSVTAADLDNDGDMDILSANKSTDEISWYMNNGNNTFTEQTKITTTADGTNSIFALDLDTDGDVDIVSANAEGNNVTWYQNNTEPTNPTVTFVENGGTTVDSYTFSTVPQEFLKQTYISETSDAGAFLSAADFNNDGNIDIFTAGSSDNTLAWYTNNGDGTFSTKTVISVMTHSIVDAAIADVDNDGDQDIITTNGYSTINWFMNDGTGSFTLQTAIYSGGNGISTINASDIDGDGDIDIFFTNIVARTISWTKNDGTGSFTTQPVMATNVFAFHIHAVDLDNDGDTDLIAANEANMGIYYYENNGSEVFSAGTLIIGGAYYATSIDTTDYDNDGDLDILVAISFYNEVVLYTNNGSEVFDDMVYMGTLADSVHQALAFDFNNDGYDDIISANFSSNTIAWYSNNKDNTFTTEPNINQSAYSVTAIFAADFDNDGDLDVIAAESTYDRLTLYLNTKPYSILDQPTEPYKVGYTFNGWYTDSGFMTSYLFTTPAINDFTLYAKHTINEYDLIFRDYDGTEIQTETYDYGADLSLVSIPTTPIRTGYQFLYWHQEVPDTMPDATYIMIAVYEHIQYDITFVNYNDATLNQESFYYNDTIPSSVIPANPTRTGYSFDGWAEEIPTIMGTEDITIHATYQINEYSIYYYDYDSNVIEVQQWNYNADLSTLVPPVAPLKEGHTFDSWSYPMPLYMPANNLHISPYYTINQYQVQFVDNEGNVLQTSLYNYGIILSTIPQPTNYAKEGYTFVSWDNPLLSNLGPSNLTITAQYTTNQYHVIFEDYNGSIISSTLYDFGTDLSTITIPTTPTRVGYSFTQWNISFDTTLGSSDLYIRAMYEMLYLITFVDYDGTVIQSSLHQLNEDLSSITFPSTPERTGYTFIGWDTTLPNTMGNSNIDIEALYELNQYTITFKDYDGTVISSALYPYGTNILTITYPQDPSRTGCTFDSWTSPITSTMLSDNIDITASYILNQYTITYDVDGVMIVEDVNYSEHPQSVPEPEKDGYSFVRWQKDDTEIDPSSYVQEAENVTFRAIFIDDINPVVTGVINEQIYEDTPTVTFNEGTATLNGEQFISGTAITKNGTYTLIVTDSVGNITTVHFTVSRLNLILYIIIGIVLLSIGGFIFIVLRKRKDKTSKRNTPTNDDKPVEVINHPIEEIINTEIQETIIEDPTNPIIPNDESITKDIENNEEVISEDIEEIIIEDIEEIIINDSKETMIDDETEIENQLVDEDTKTTND